MMTTGKSKEETDSEVWLENKHLEFSVILNQTPKD